MNVVDVLVAEVAARAKVAPSDVDVDAHLIAAVGLSSLEVLSVLAVAEERFAVRFPDEELPTLSTVRKIAAAVDARRSP